MGKDPVVSITAALVLEGCSELDEVDSCDRRSELRKCSDIL